MDKGLLGGYMYFFVSLMRVIVVIGLKYQEIALEVDSSDGPRVKESPIW